MTASAVRADSPTARPASQGHRDEPFEQDDAVKPAQEDEKTDKMQHSDMKCTAIQHAGESESAASDFGHISHGC